MRMLIAAVLMTVFSPLAFALSPYFYGSKLPAGELQAVMGQVESKDRKSVV